MEAPLCGFLKVIMNSLPLIWPFFSSKFQNPRLQGCLFSQKVNNHTPLVVKWIINKYLKATEIIFLKIYAMIGSDSHKSNFSALEFPQMG